MMLASGFVHDLIFQGTTRLLLAVLLVACVLWLVRVRLPKLHRWMWSAVLLQSLLLGPLAISLPVLSPVEPLEAIGSDAVIGDVASVSPETLQVATGALATREQSREAIVTSWIGMQLIAVVWTVGFAGVLSIFALSHLIVQWSLHRAVPAREAWQNQLQRVKDNLGVFRRVDLRTTANWGPLLTRSWRGHCIVVPRRNWEALDDGQREAVLIHELAHLERGDLKWSLMMRLAASFHWFNPLAWWVVAKFDEAAEWACDGMVSRQSDRHAAALAGALLQFSGPKPLIRLGVSMAQGSKVSVRVRRLVDPSPVEESKMKKCLFGGLAALILVTGLLRLELVAKEFEDGAMNSGGGASSDMNVEFSTLLSQLSGSTDELQQRLVAALRTDSGQLVLRDHLQKLSGGDGGVVPAELVDSVLEKHFIIEGDVAKIRDEQSPLKEELIRVGSQSTEDIAKLSAACQALSEKLVGDDETTLLIKRFLQEEAGPKMLYIKELRARMRPSTEMLTKTFGRALAQDSNGQFHVRPDAREKMQQIISLRDEAVRRSEQLSKEIRIWADELEDADELHRRVKQDAQEHLFAARFVAEAVFGKHDLSRVRVSTVLEQLDGIVVDTSKGLRLRDEARAEVEEVLTKYETMRDRAEALRASVKAFGQLVSTDDEVSAAFKEMLQTEIALVAAAMGSETVNTPADQLVRGMLAQVLEEVDGGLRVRQDAELNSKITSHIQDAFREFRQARRHAAPIRELADRLDDAEVADALTSVGGMLVMRRQLEMVMADVQQQRVEAWKDEMFAGEGKGKEIREEARPRVETFLKAVAKVQAGLTNDDF